MEREQLPVKQFEEEIMATIDSNPVVIIRGATGCGKTTQVPQYILDRFIKGGRASHCNVVVTQVTPRVVCYIILSACLLLIQLPSLSPAQKNQRGVGGRASGL